MDIAPAFYFGNTFCSSNMIRRASSNNSLIRISGDWLG
nr:MAG TPA: hypothetical protein [Caudoviricetes sp.]